MNDAHGPKARNEARPVKRGPSGRMAVLLIACVLFAAVVLPRLRGPARHEVRGTVTKVDVAGRQATLEYLDPANGATREITGDVPPSCTITINGESAALPDLRIGDAIVARAVIERYKRAGKRKKRIVAEEIDVSRIKTKDR